MKKLLSILLFVSVCLFAQTNSQYIEQNRPLDLNEGWNMIGFTCNEPIDVIDAFSPIYDKVIIAKDNNGAVYLPEFAFNGIGFFEYGYGYQLKLTESISNFQFCPFLVPLVEGCMDETACNYNPEANMADGSCTYAEQGYDCEGNLNVQVGDLAEGGIVFYVDETGERLLITSIEDLTIQPLWWFDAIDSLSSFNLSTQYDDWFVPRKNELEQMYNSIGNESTYGELISFSNTNSYWSASQNDNLDHFTFRFYNGSSAWINKFNSCHLKPIRAVGNWTMGCMDSLACNYNPEANMADGSCEYPELGYDCEGNFVCYYPEDLSFIYWLEDYYPSVLSSSNCIDLESASSYTGPLIIGPDSTMQNIDGIQYFNNTTYLEINGLRQLIEIPDISSLINLDTLAIGNNDVLTSLPDLSGLTDLSTIGIGYNYSLESLPDLSDLSNLIFLDINDNYSLTTLPDLSGLSNLDTLLIYNNTSLECALGYPEQLSIEDVWPPVCEQEFTYQVGDLAEGGIVFYVDETGEHGLVSSLEDLTEGATIDSEGNPGYQWGCFATGISGADGQVIGTGYQNTLDIASGCSETLIAASEALAYESEDYSDWYLPSLDELNEMYNTIGTGGSEGNTGGFISNWYWSSSESNNYGAYDINFGDGSTGNFSSKTKIVRVRVIRSF